MRSCFTLMSLQCKCNKTGLQNSKGLKGLWVKPKAKISAFRKGNKHRAVPILAHIQFMLKLFVSFGKNMFNLWNSTAVLQLLDLTSETEAARQTAVSCFFLPTPPPPACCVSAERSSCQSPLHMELLRRFIRTVRNLRRPEQPRSEDGRKLRGMRSLYTEKD